MWLQNAPGFSKGCWVNWQKSTVWTGWKHLLISNINNPYCRPVMVVFSDKLYLISHTASPPILFLRKTCIRKLGWLHIKGEFAPFFSILEPSDRVHLKQALEELQFLVLQLWIYFSALDLQWVLVCPHSLQVPQQVAVIHSLRSNSELGDVF